MSYQSPMRFDKANTVQDLLETYGDHMYCLGKYYEAGNTISIDAGERIAEQFWSRLEQLVGGRPAPGIGAGKTIGDEDVRDGMRVKLIKCTDSGDPPEGTKGTISIPDKDGLPGVDWDVDGDFNQYYEVNALEDISDVE